MSKPIHIIGGGLAGSEAAFQAAEAGIDVILHEMRPVRPTFAHQTDSLAELVCSNSFRSDDAVRNAVGLLHAEMRDLGSLIMAQADIHKVPAGSALAVDRDGFSAGVTAAMDSIVRAELAPDAVENMARHLVYGLKIDTGPAARERLKQGWLYRPIRRSDERGWHELSAMLQHSVIGLREKH